MNSYWPSRPTGRFRYTKERRSNTRHGDFESHIQRFDLLATMLESGEQERELLEEIERRDNIFAEIDHRVYLP